MLRERVAQRGQGAQRRAQLREIARPRGAQRDARENALDVADAAQLLAQRLRSGAVDERAERRDSASAARRDP